MLQLLKPGNTYVSFETLQTDERLKGKVAIVTASTDGYMGSQMLVRMLKLMKPGNMSHLKYKNIVRTKSDGRFEGKVAIVTASTDGIGYAIAKKLGDGGASVVISSRKQANVDNAVKSLRNDGINVEGVVCHVGNAEQRTQLFEVAKKKFGGLDILVSNAAVNPGVGPVLDINEKVWDKIFETNVKCAWLLAKEAYPELIKRRGGNILFISSIAAYNPEGPISAYGISKTALLGLTKGIANETARDNIRVNCVAPGVVPTKFAAVITESVTAKERSLSMIPMHRFGKPSEIANAVAFLVSDEASFITGETVVVAGGDNARL